MIKAIEYQNKTRMIIIKNGDIVADMHISNIHGGIDTDKIKVCVTNDPFDNSNTIVLEV